MGERRPTRSSSRLNSEPPNPNPIEGLSRQSKRIQGQESSDAEQAEPIPRLTRGTGVERGLRNGGRVTKRQVPKGTANRLPTVTESSANDDPNLDPELRQLTTELYAAANDIKEDYDRNDLDEALQQQLREASSASAVTAQTSFSQQELRELDHDVMLDALPDLYHAAKEVTGLVISGEIGSQVQHLNDRNSRVYKRLCRLGKVHRAQKEGFGTGQYINPDIALWGILDVRYDDSLVNPTSSGPLNVFFLSNIATLFVATFTLERNAFVEKLDSEFASLFLIEVHFPRQADHSLNGYHELRAETFDLALDIRTQHCVSLLKQNLRRHHTDTDEIIRQCFFTVLEEQDDMLKGWDTKGLRTQDLLATEKNDIGRRIQAIKDALDDIPELGEDDAIRSLDGRFRWSDLQANIIQWAAHRSGEIEKEVDARGGAETIRTDIETARAQRLGGRNDLFDTEETNGPNISLEYNPSEISHPPTDAIEPHSSAQPKRLPLFTNPRAVRMLLPADGENIRTAEAALRVQEAWQPDDIADEQFSHHSRYPLSDLQPSDVIDLAKQNKENIPEPVQPGPAPRVRLVDPQPGATRVTFDTQESTQPGPPNQRSFRHPDQIVDHPGSDYLPEPTQDEGFQTDTRPGFQNAPVVNMRRGGEEIAPTRPRKRARTSRPTPRARITSPIARNTPQEQPATTMDLIPGSQAEMYAQVNTQSRLRASQIVKPRKAKEPWTNDEINALVDYIARWGFLCGKIKEVDRAGPRRLERRDNVALKDKARNMKMDYLRGQIALPLNFDEVPLNKALDQRLRDAGIEPPPVIKRGGEVDA